MTMEQAAALRETLEAMFDHIEKKQNMADDLRQIQKLHDEIATTAPPILIHYLQRRSYTKALEFLKGEFLVEEVVQSDANR